ncbi:MAG: hypothetical protein JW918_09230 [Anaerolineae bacterium]|nr:hypothetical protein [Anaerolineae bacterium]
MIGPIPFELLGLVCTIICIVALSVALVTYIQRSRQRKRDGDHPAVVTQAEPNTPANKESAYTRVGELVQKATTHTVETLTTTLTSVENKLASPETKQARLSQKPASPPSGQKVPHRPIPEPALPSSAIEPPPLGKPVTGIPGRTLDPLNLAGEIDQMVQQKLKNRPDLAGRRVRLANSLDGGLRIYVDDHVFETVGDVTDFKVREIIRDAIREWEGV